MSKIPLRFIVFAKNKILPSTRPTRILIFNCTSGRSGDAFLGSMLAKGAEQLTQYTSSEDINTFFDRVIFCANVTYADGGFKGGE